MGTAGLLLTGCPGDDGNGDEGAASSGSTSMASTSATDNPTGGSNNTMTASGEGSGGSTMGSADATATQGSESATQGSESESASGDTTAGETEGGVCDGLGAMECMSTEGCMPIVGSPIDASGVGGTPCLDEREFIECQPAIGCGDAITYACEGDDAQMYQFLDTCIPVGWVECGPRPPGELPPCGG